MNPKPRRVISSVKTGEVCGTHHRTCVKWGKDPNHDFPQPIKLSENRLGFYEDEIYRWLESRRIRPEAHANAA